LKHVNINGPPVWEVRDGINPALQGLQIGTPGNKGRFRAPHLNKKTFYGCTLFYKKLISAKIKANSPFFC